MDEKQSISEEEAFKALDTLVDKLEESFPTRENYGGLQRVSNLRGEVYVVTSPIARIQFDRLYRLVADTAKLTIPVEIRVGVQKDDSKTKD